MKGCPLDRTWHGARLPLQLRSPGRDHVNKIHSTSQQTGLTGLRARKKKGGNVNLWEDTRRERLEAREVESWDGHGQDILEMCMRVSKNKSEIF